VNIGVAISRFRASLSHWGPAEYVVLAAFWLALSIPLYLLGWGMASILSLPLFLLLIAAATFALSPLVKPKPRPPVRPRSGLPETVEHPSLGRFVLSSVSNAFYNQSIDWCKSRTLLSLEIEVPDDLIPVQEAAISLLGKSEAINLRVVEYLVQNLLPEANQDQQSCGKPSLSSEQLRERISLENITINSRGEYVFMFGCNGLLGDHWVQVVGTLANDPTEYDLAG
jgi:hypothetical protein